MVKKRHYKRCKDPNCRRRGKLLDLQKNFYKFKGGKYGRRAICKECFNNRYATLLNKSKKRREYLLSTLLNTISEEEKTLTREFFGGRCALSNKNSSIQLDHFVPLSWGKTAIELGIGGTRYENMLPLHSTLNKSKSSNNPFEWIEKAYKKHHIDREQWLKAIKYIADKHGMTVAEYENKVNECYSIVTIKKAVKRLNKVLREGRRKPFYIIKSLIHRGTNIEVAIQKFGSIKAKDYISSEEGNLELNRIKNELYMEILDK